MSTVRNTVAPVIGAPLTYGLPVIDRPGGPTLIDRAAQLAIPASSATVRYVIPAAGLTAAGMQLAQLTNGMYDYASEQPLL